VVDAIMVSMGRALVGGMLIGLASWFLLASLGRIAGISGVIAHALVPSHASGEPPGKWSSRTASAGAWRWWFLAALSIGGALFSWALNAQHPLQMVQWPALWVMLVSGLLVGVGTVVGSGCTSGHGVCGLGRLSFRSLVAVMVFMAMGMLTASLIRPWILETLSP
jgi:uncharacterized protein